MAEAALAASARDALATAAARLAAAGCETPRLDGEVLLASVLGVERARLVIDASRPLDAAAEERFAAVVERRAAREPVAYIVGYRGFRRIDLAVDRRVLIPRPETELLVEVGLSLPFGARVADVGTGCGAVALALKDERPDLVVTGSDLSEEAVAVASSNAARLGLDVTFVVADLLDGLRGPFDAVLANLPYVVAGSALAPEIAEYEPPEALFAGSDGLEVIRRLVSLADAGLIALEVGWGQADAVAALVRRAGYASVERRHDLAGVERVVVGRT